MDLWPEKVCGCAGKSEAKVCSHGQLERQCLVCDVMAENQMLSEANIELAYDCAIQENLLGDQRKQIIKMDGEIKRWKTLLSQREGTLIQQHECIHEAVTENFTLRRKIQDIKDTLDE